MASLKEIKGRISSVKSTQKITSAMKMVSSAKLRKAQSQIEHFLPYQEKLNVILNSFLASASDFNTKLAEEREIKNVAIVVVSSNSSLCGAFNSNIIKLLNETLNKYKKQNCANIEVYAVGKKVGSPQRVPNRRRQNVAGAALSCEIPHCRKSGKKRYCYWPIH